MGHQSWTVRWNASTGREQTWLEGTHWGHSFTVLLSLFCPSRCPQPQGKCPAHGAHLWGHSKTDISNMDSSSPGDAVGCFPGKERRGHRDSLVQSQDQGEISEGFCMSKLSILHPRLLSRVPTSL